MKARPQAVHVDCRVAPGGEQDEAPRTQRIDPQAAARETGMSKGGRRQCRPPASTMPPPPPAKSERSAARESRGHRLIVQHAARLQPFRSQPPETGGGAEQAAVAPQAGGWVPEAGQEARVAVLRLADRRPPPEPD